MENKKITRHMKNGLILLACLLAAALLLHLAMNYLVPFISSMHNGGNAY